MSKPLTDEELELEIHSFAEDIADQFGGDIDIHPQTFIENKFVELIQKQKTAVREECRKDFMTAIDEFPKDKYTAVYDVMVRAIEWACREKTKE